ncbi:MAG: ATP-dependent DNA helicase RecG [Candidatus Liptonbacteria bacterium]
MPLTYSRPTLALQTPLSRIAGIGPRFLTKFKKLNIETVEDLLRHFPSRYEDFSQIYPIAELEPGQQATIQGEIEDIESHRTWRRHMTVVSAIVKDQTGTIRATWFNQPYIKNILKTGTLANFSGKVAVSEEDHELYLSHPTYERIGGRISHPTRHTARLVPVYPETSGLTSKGIRFILQPILEHLPEIPDWMPEEILTLLKFPPVADAYKHVHFPETLEEALAAKQRFAFEDLFLLQFVNAREKSRLASRKAPELTADIEKVKKVLTGLPFPLTFSQKKSLWEIIKDIGKAHPMNRLLQGDVGAGKPVVAAIAALIAAQNGHQTSFMAPTEVLARQHFETLKKLFGKSANVNSPPIALITSSITKIFYDEALEESMSRERVLSAVASGEVKIIVGTHALISEEKPGRSKKKVKAVAFKNLGLAIIDEQHRFGVDQRARLVHEKHSEKSLLPHFLSMSATPIPRTLMLTLFGDLDISTITELPVGRKSIITKIVLPGERLSTYDFVRSEIKKGRQAFVICPRITASQSDDETGAQLELKSVEEEFKKLSEKIYPDLKIAMLHGQMKSTEKERTMKAFRGGETNILVSTSVIEVGVDIPNASVTMIEGSDRFGLAQLYQFRGRVGRGEHQSYCFLLTDSSSTTTSKRLRAILEAKNGFELAEKDLELRGPGEFLGQRQTGLPDEAMRGLQNIEAIRQSRVAAHEVIEKDPALKNYPLLRAKVLELQRRLHLE